MFYIHHVHYCGKYTIYELGWRRMCLFPPWEYNWLQRLFEPCTFHCTNVVHTSYTTLKFIHHVYAALTYIECFHNKLIIVSIGSKPNIWHFCVCVVLFFLEHKHWCKEQMFPLPAACLLCPNKLRCTSVSVCLCVSLNVALCLYECVGECSGSSGDQSVSSHAEGGGAEGGADGLAEGFTTITSNRDV